VSGNRFLGNGTFGNNTNGDLANATLDFPIRNCFFDNKALKKGTLTSSPVNIEDAAVLGSCNGPWVGDSPQETSLFLQLLCNAYGPASGACSALDHYPAQTGVTLLPIPREPGMSNPCQGVPRNSWCS